MHLRRLTIRRFRSCEDVTIRLARDLTVIAGENNAGKTNVLDAIRLLTAPSDGRRTRYADRADVRRGASDPAVGFEIVGQFSGLSDLQRGLFVSALGDPASERASWGMRFSTGAEDGPRGRVRFWAGPREGNEPEPEARELIRHVHLPALRDAQRELASSQPTRIAALLRQLAGADESAIPRLEAEAKRAMDIVGEDPLVVEASERVSAGLASLTDGAREHRATLRFADASLLGLARDLRFFLRRKGVEPIDLAESGLGYANLLYLASVLVELDESKEAELTLFLVEEPEAHLHPQLQRIAIEYLRHRARLSRRAKQDGTRPAGHIQVVVTTHSPHMTSAVPCAKVVVLRAVDPKPDSRGDPAPAASPTDAPVRGPTAYPKTAAIAIRRLDLPRPMRDKIDRYLDVTRSELLFGRRILLVEGLAEALLLPVLARRRILCQRADAKALASFRGSTIVAVDGVDFGPYIRLLLTPVDGFRIARRVAVVTDGDAGEGERRKADLERIAAEIHSKKSLHVAVARWTLEADLYAAGNGALLKEAFLDLKPRSESKWTDEIDSADENDQPEALVGLLAASRVRKGEFAQTLAGFVEAGRELEVPDYLAGAVRFVAGATGPA